MLCFLVKIYITIKGYFISILLFKYSNVSSIESENNKQIESDFEITLLSVNPN